MITVPKALIAELEALVADMEAKGIEAEDAAARLNIALGDMLTVATDRSRLAHKAHALLRKMKEQG